jgi:hypothetical protein
MRKAVSISLPESLFIAALEQAAAEHRTFSNYIASLLHGDLDAREAVNPRKPASKAQVNEFLDGLDALGFFPEEDK